MIDHELDSLENLIRQNPPDLDGYGTCEIGPGFALNQGCLLGATSYLLHYKFEVISDTAKFAVINKADFEGKVAAKKGTAPTGFLEDLNTQEAALIVTDLPRYPTFKF